MQLDVTLEQSRAYFFIPTAPSNKDYYRGDIPVCWSLKVPFHVLDVTEVCEKCSCAQTCYDREFVQGKIAKTLLKSFIV